MKRAAIISALLLVSICSQAQWNKTHQAADELRGTEERDVVSYTDPNGNKIIWWSDNDGFALYMADGIFDYHTYYYLRTTVVTVGLYKEGRLDFKDVYTFNVEEGGKRAFISGGSSKKNGKLVDMINNHIMNVGPARFIANKYGMGDMDLVVPMYDFEEEETTK